MKRSNRTTDEPIHTYADVLKKAHKRGLVKIKTIMIQYPIADNGLIAICKATVTIQRRTKDHVLVKKFTSRADATPQNTEPDFHQFLIQTSETRAKGRALRDALGLGPPILEEFKAGMVLATTRQENLQDQGEKSATVVKGLLPKPKDDKDNA